MKKLNLAAVIAAMSLTFFACSSDSSDPATSPILGDSSSSIQVEEEDSSTSIASSNSLSYDSEEEYTVNKQSSSSANVLEQTSSETSSLEQQSSSSERAVEQSSSSRPQYTPTVTNAPAVLTPANKVNFPFPQNSDYNGNATLLSNKAAAAQDLKKGFEWWLNAFYNESADKTIAGVRSNEGSNEYFSEGVGYGMLLTVYFSDNERSYQAEFDKLWNFYKKFENKNGLMIWKIGNLSESWDAGNGAALDGDIDAAAALIMAAYQFGDAWYLEEAKTLIQSMKKSEFEGNGLHMPGDAWGAGAYTRKNPGYFDPAYMPLFAAVDDANADFWSGAAYEANMNLYETSSNEVETGLIDDWTNQNGKSEDDYYNYDASRAPWRNAKAVCWYGDTRALAIDQKMAKFVSTVSAANMKGPVIRSSGSLGNDHNSTFVSSLMTALISDPSYQKNLDEYWAEAVNLGNENYFNQSLKLLNGLLVSGNMPNLLLMSMGK